MLLRYGEGREVATTGNLLLRSLSAADRALLACHFEDVTFSPGSMPLKIGDEIDAIYFPEAGLCAVEEGMRSARHTEVAVVGREGLLGWPALLGCSYNTHNAVAQSQEFRAKRIAVPAIVQACRESPSLWLTLISFVQSVMHQLACAITSYLENHLDKNIARWLLMRHDRLFGDHIFVHHSEIAEALSARRSSITDHLHLMEGELLLRCRRNCITIRDRFGLEAFASNAYGEAEALYRNLLGPFGKSATIEIGSNQAEPVVEITFEIKPPDARRPADEQRFLRSLCKRPFR